MATGDPVVYLDFSGGVHIDEGTYLLSDNQCQDCLNVRSTEHGALEKREAFKRINDLAPLDSAHTLFEVNLGSYDTLLAAGPDGVTGKLIAFNGENPATTVGTGLDPDARWEFVQGPVGNQTPGASQGSAALDQGPIYGMNGVDAPVYWSGNPAESVQPWVAWAGTVPSKTKYLIYHLDKFWASGDPDFPGRVYSTGVQDENVFQTLLPDPCNWDSSYIDDVDPNDGEAITGLGKVGPYVLVFKARKTYVLSDPQGRFYRQVSSTIGCTAHRSIVETENGTLFYSEDVGVCITDGSNIRVVSESIDPLLAQIARTNPTSLKNIVGTYYKGSYFMSVPRNSGQNDTLLEYKLDNNSWWIHGVGVDDFALLDPVGLPRLYSVRPGVGSCERCFQPYTYIDTVGPYESYWTGPYWTWGNPHLNKRISQFRMDGEGNWAGFAAERFKADYEQMYAYEWDQVEVGDQIFAPAVADGNTFAPASDDGTIFGSDTTGVREVRYPTPLDGWGRAWSIKVTDQSAGKRFLLYSITAFVRSRTD